MGSELTIVLKHEWPMDQQMMLYLRYEWPRGHLLIPPSALTSNFNEYTEHRFYLLKRILDVGKLVPSYMSTAVKSQPLPQSSS